MRRRRYGVEERERILADAERLGVAKAARLHGMAESSLSNWRNRDAKGAGKPSVEGKRARTQGGRGAPSDGPESHDAVAIPAKPVKAPPRKRTAKSYTPSQKAEVLEHAAAHGVSVTSDKFGVSRFSI